MDDETIEKEKKKEELEGKKFVSRRKHQTRMSKEKRRNNGAKKEIPKETE